MDTSSELSVRQQCRLLGLDRSGLYDKPVPPDAQEIALCYWLDELYTDHPHFGVRWMTQRRRREGRGINPKRGRRLVRRMGLLAVYPQPRLSLPGAGAQVFPYLLRDLHIVRPHQVRS